MSNAVRMQRSLRLIISRERSQVPYEDHQGHLEVHVTNTIGGNNKEVIKDCAKVYRDCTGAIRLNGH